ncbi:MULTISPECIES: tellurite resistance TerB C-terminal domain-containing protein [unclassified Coleofasciculus]|uniref:tellurite resistance TerB C-terminal domain-containing protein n=1 Tax=unclassified Coleofasciculus TaxID=2692782 RepID=UPI00188139D7|nr:MULTISPECIES: tellurite resistance TerB C-terminal domain-containing protein [unclassified Coleofasciculus]MBE9125482.1 hypothetical protein [Coleofasciculus sp. LEGE 07081]MBE9147453.1 hypothetical protein [Coleofasciculus sp. LEGE 07092]
MTQLVNQILLGAVAFAVSFGIGLFTNPNKALLNGAITVVASSVGAMVAEKRRLEQEKRHKHSLLNQIQDFEEEESLLYESLSKAMAIEHQLEASVSALQGERSQLLHRISELHTQRNELYQELGDVQQQKQQQLQEIYNLQTQIRQIEKHQSELNQSLWAKTAQVPPAETRLNRLHTELEELQSQIADKLTQHEQLYEDLITLEHKKQELGGEAYDLQTQILALKQRWEELNQSLLFLRIQQQQVQGSLTSLKSELHQLQSQVSQKQQQQEQLSQDLATLETLKQQIETDYQYLQTQMEALQRQNPEMFQYSSKEIQGKLSGILPEEWWEWLDFIQQLSEDDKVVFKAILERDEATLKRIASEKLTMPQVLITSINDRTLEKFNDILFFSDGTSIIPELNEDYLSILVKSRTVCFKDLLELNLHQSSKISLLH